MKVESESENNKIFLKRFVKDNCLGTTAFRSWTIGGEIEGRVLLQVQPGISNSGEDEGIAYTPIKVKYYSWLWYDYKIISNDQTGYSYDYATFIDKGNQGKNIVLPFEEIVYVKLGGEERFINSPTPVTASILTDIDAVDDALIDLRQINKKFGAGFIFFETLEAQTAQDILNQIHATNWRVGQVLAGPAKAYYVTPSSQSIQNMETEITMRVECISGATGVPVHFLGFIKLFNTKAGAEELTQVLNARTSNERMIWREQIRELLRKAMAINTKINGTPHDLDDIEVEIPAGTLGQLEQLSQTFLPLQQGGIISKNAVRMRIPNYNAENDEENMEEEAAELEKKRTDRLTTVSNQIFGETTAGVKPGSNMPMEPIK